MPTTPNSATALTCEPETPLSGAMTGYFAKCQEKLGMVLYAVRRGQTPSITVLRANPGGRHRPGVQLAGDRCCRRAIAVLC